MKFIVKIPVIVEQANGKGIPRHHYASVAITACDVAEAVRVVAANIASSISAEVYIDDAAYWG